MMYLCLCFIICCCFNFFIFNWLSFLRKKSMIFSCVVSFFFVYICMVKLIDMDCFFMYYILGFVGAFVVFVLSLAVVLWLLKRFFKDL